MKNHHHRPMRPVFETVRLFTAVTAAAFVASACGADTESADPARLQQIAAALEVPPTMQSNSGTHTVLQNDPCVLGEGLYVLRDLFDPVTNDWLGQHIFDADRIDIDFGEKPPEFSQVAHIEIINCSPNEIVLDHGNFTDGNDLESANQVFRKDGWTGGWPLHAAESAIAHYARTELTLHFTPNAVGQFPGEFVLGTSFTERPRITFALIGTSPEL